MTTPHKELRRLGRVIGESPIEEALNGQGGMDRTFTLASGKKVTFIFQTIPYEEIEARTYVDMAVNGRDQNAITEESLRDITQTIHLQQFFPAIGRVVGNRIEILDGSRRRMACLNKKVGFNVLVTSEQISASDARMLARAIQTAKEHSIRDLGVRFMVLRETGMNNKEIAAAEGISEAKVTRAFQAASVPSKIVSLFPVASELSHKDYKTLLDMVGYIEKNEIELETIIDEVSDRIAGDAPYDGLGQEEVKVQIMKHLHAVTFEKKSLNTESPVVVTKCVEFKTPSMFARKKENKKSRVVAYEFGRLSKDVMTKLDEAIQSVLEAYATKEND